LLLCVKLRESRDRNKKIPNSLIGTLFSGTRRNFNLTTTSAVVRVSRTTTVYAYLRTIGYAENTKKTYTYRLK